ncbi:hypothetical protein DSUL_20046 [Desulfovibrionales bacterium]
MISVTKLFTLHHSSYRIFGSAFQVTRDAMEQQQQSKKNKFKKDERGVWNLVAM